MSIFSWFTDMFSTVGDSPSMSDDDSPSMSDDDFMVNPANGLPIVGGIGGVDVEGNPFGTDFSHDCITSSSSDDSFSNTTSIDDSWS